MAGAGAAAKIMDESGAGKKKQFQLRITAEQRLLFVGTGSEVLSTEALFASSCKFQLKCYSLASKTEISQF